MRLWIRVLWTAAAVIAIAWPLLFWGKAASLDSVRERPAAAGAAQSVGAPRNPVVSVI